MKTDFFELKQSYHEIREKFNEYKECGLSLDMSRGKPNSEQLDISSFIINDLDKKDYMSKEGFDCRNYGAMDGILEAKELFAEILGTNAENIIIGGNSSLNLMYDMISDFVTHGSIPNKPWSKENKIKFLCPCPGYDRHFAITEYFGFENIAIPMQDDGPDLDIIEKIVSTDPQVKGIWCVPKYSNPTGAVYSDEKIKRLANLKPASADFRIFWDNAYVVHDLYEEIEILDIIEECKKAGNPDMAIEFASFSKITFGGSGISCIASSVTNINNFKKRIALQTVGYDKLNQLRHVKAFKDKNSITAHMKKHAEFLRPKIEIVLNKLEENFGGLNICDWTKPKGGYFVSFDSADGQAKKIIEYCKECGLVLTPAGSAYPKKIDEKDSNIRIAPSFPSLNELSLAMDIFCVCVKLVYLENLNNEK